MESADQLFKTSFPGFGYIRAWGGITFLEEYQKDTFEVKKEKSEIRKSQVEKFEFDFLNSTYKSSLFIFGTNDFKALVSQNGKLLEISKRCARYWKTLDKHLDKKINFDPTRTKFLLGKDAMSFIKQQVERLLEYFIEVIKKSDMTTIFWSSFLERIYVDCPNLDLLFCYINYYMKEGLHQYNEKTVYNKSNKKVKFVFVNVASQFYSTTDPLTLARKDEAERGELIHRNVDSMKNLAEIYVESILEVLS